MIVIVALHTDVVADFLAQKVPVHEATAGGAGGVDRAVRQCLHA
ncbi:hypothetical protein [Streptomyces sp. NPDC059371]